jgi:hypothetical protein
MVVMSVRNGLKWGFILFPDFLGIGFFGVGVDLVDIVETSYNNIIFVVLCGVFVASRLVGLAVSWWIGGVGGANAVGVLRPGRMRAGAVPGAWRDGGR